MGGLAERERDTPGQDGPEAHGLESQLAQHEQQHDGEHRGRHGREAAPQRARLLPVRGQHDDETGYEGDGKEKHASRRPHVGGLGRHVPLRARRQAIRTSDATACSGRLSRADTR